MPAMISAPEPLAVEEGAKVLMRGGNAIDAAVTCAFVEGVVNPQMTGVGGYLTATVHMAGQLDSQSLALDAPALAGSSVTPDIWAQQIIGPNPDGWGFFVQGKLNDRGYQSICTPGAVRGLATLLSTWGSISWGDAIAPAARIAAGGFVVDEHLARGWKTKASYPEACSLLERIVNNPEASRIYLNGKGAPHDSGECLRNTDYARTLAHIAAYGPDDFYIGEMAQRMSADLAGGGSFVTAADLADYKMRDVSPVLGTYRGYTIASAPAPHGGPTLVAILNILEQYNLRGMEHNSPQFIHLLAMAMKAAFADRNPYLGDPQFVDTRQEWMVSKERAERWQSIIDARRPITVSFAPSGSAHTTHVSVVDHAGNCVALTHSLGSSSGVITPGLGFMYNNSMCNFDVRPGLANSIAPRKGRTTGMSPTVVYKGGKPVIVIGAPGATKILTSVAQVLVNLIDFGMGPAEAILAPRIDCQGDRIICQMRIPQYICDEVAKLHPIVRLPQSHGGLGLVHAITVDELTGELRGGADTGAGGMALRVP